MHIILAKNAGFCFGVKRAVDAVFDVIDKKENIYTFGPLIHNPQFISELKKRGVGVLESISKVKKGDTIIIRSHGVSDSVIEKIKEKGAEIIDATCPFVKRVQNEAKTMEKEGYSVFITGKSDHPEVKGVLGNLKKGEIIEDLASAEKLRNFPRIGIVSQTTFERFKLNKILEFATSLNADLKIVNTICNATQEKQEEVFNLSKKVEVLIVIGGKNSSNTTHLAEVASKNAKTFHIELAEEIDKNWFKGVEKVGITAGASTPDYLIEQVKQTVEAMS